MSSFAPYIGDMSKWPDFTFENPFVILFSACLLGEPCGVDGTSYGEFPKMIPLSELPNVKMHKFCPENFSFGTPRATPDIHGGDGFDVLDGKAKVFNEKGEDWTEGMVAAAKRMAEIALDINANLAVMADTSAACGSQVVYDGCRFKEDKRYQQGVGVAAAALIRAGVSVVSQRDFKTLEQIFKKLNPEYKVDTEAIDHHETKWYREYFGLSTVTNEG